MLSDMVSAVGLPLACRRLRSITKWSQKDLACKLQVGQSSVSRWECTVSTSSVVIRVKRSVVEKVNELCRDFGVCAKFLVRILD